MTSSTGRAPLWRSRWAAVGAALAVVAGAGGIGWAGAAGEQPVSVAVAPCRLFDTRPGTRNVGAKSTPLAAGDAAVMTVQVTGPSGRCNLPAGATSVRMNLTVVGGTSNSFLTVFPADLTRPAASAINWSAGQAPLANMVETTLSADGRLRIFNSVGTVDLLADVTGFTIGHAPRQIAGADLGAGRWDRDPARPTAVAVGLEPTGHAVFDGRDMWATRERGATVGGQPVRVVELVGLDPARSSEPSNPVRVDTTSTVTEQVRVNDVLFDGTSIWVATERFDTSTTTGSTLVQVDPVRRSVLRRVDLAGPTTAMAHDGTALWVARKGSQFVRRVAAGGAALTDAKFSDPVSDLAFDGTSMWGVVPSAAAVEPRNPATGNAAGSPVTVGVAPRFAAFDGTTLWVSSSSGTSVARVDVATAATSAPVPVGGVPSGLVVTGEHLWVSTPGGATRVRLLTGTVESGQVATNGATVLATDGTNVWFDGLSDALRRFRLR